MATVYKKAAAAVERLEKDVADEKSPNSAGRDVVERDDAVAGIVAELASLTDDINKMKKRALETEPDRIIYGKAMATKVCHVSVLLLIPSPTGGW